MDVFKYNPSVSVNLDSSPFNTPLRFVAAVDRALPARTIHRGAFWLRMRKEKPSLCNGARS